jgi:predicted permease
VSRGGARRWLRLPVRDPARTAADIDAELAAHVAARAERLEAAGLSPAAARAEAERRLGGLDRARERLLRATHVRDARLSSRERLRGWGDDVRYALRAVFREPIYAIVVIGTLALVIGANATMFGILDRLLLSGPAHVEAPDDLYRFYLNVRWEPADALQTFAPLNWPALETFRAGVTSVEHASASLSSSLTVGSGPTARRIEVGAATASFFELLGTQPVLGRWFDASEDRPPAGERVIVLSHGMWQRDFGGRADVLGQTLELSGARYEVVGVAPPGFTGVGLEPRDGWVPLAGVAAARMGDAWQTSSASLFLPLIARLRPGATIERAAAEATAAWRAAYDGPVQAQREAFVSLHGIGAGGDGQETLEARVARWLVAVSGIVLLVACANVANLYFARGLRRRREIAVRLALGISRWRLVRLLLLESVTLALLGGMAALAVAYWGADLVRALLLPQVEWAGSPLDVRVLAFAAAATALAGIITGLAPALQAANPALSPALTGSVHAPPAPGRARNVLAVVQAAFCVVLLVGAGLFVRSFWTVNALDLGVDADRVLALHFEWQAGDDEAAGAAESRRAAFIDEALARLGALPGVEHASAAVGSAFVVSYGGSVRAGGVDSIPQLPGGGPYLSAVTGDYFATLGTPLLRGRTFHAGERGGTEPVVILSRTMAETLWPGADPLGRCLFVGRGANVPCSRVVGVVADVRRFRIQEAAAMQFYVPLGQQPAFMTGPTVLLRTPLPPAHLAVSARAALHQFEPSLRYVHAQPFAEILDREQRPWKLGAAMFALCGALAFVIALVGLYSVIAYLVLHRRHEIGVRAALGAGRARIVGMVMRQALLIASAGIIVGAGVALLAAPSLEPLLFETAPRDPVVLATVVLTLLLAALAAGAAPALRASRIPAMQALREY